MIFKPSSQYSSLLTLQCKKFCCWYVQLGFKKFWVDRSGAETPEIIWGDATLIVWSTVGCFVNIHDKDRTYDIFPSTLNSLRPRQNGSHFANDILNAFLMIALCNNIRLKTSYRDFDPGVKLSYDIMAEELGARDGGVGGWWRWLLGLGLGWGWGWGWVAVTVGVGGGDGWGGGGGGWRWRLGWGWGWVAVTVGVGVGDGWGGGGGGGGWRWRWGWGWGWVAATVTVGLGDVACYFDLRDTVRRSRSVKTKGSHHPFDICIPSSILH